MNTIKSNPRTTLRPRLLTALAAPLAAAIMMALPSTSMAQISISVDFAPPPIPVYEQPPLPGEGYIWTPGYWAYGDDDYYWVPGTWVLPPTVGYLWTPGYWGWEDGSYVFHDGYWGSHVGFYGGVNYGFGYGGRGYEGGYWDGDAFYYNRNVNAFGDYRVQYVYERPVVNITINRVSYNGGDGGIAARATADEARAASERHIQPIGEQQRQRELAVQNRELRASVNHGAPPVAATQKPGVFQGPGVVRAHEPSPQERAAIDAREARANRVDAKSNAPAAPANRQEGNVNAAQAQSARERAAANTEAARTNGQDARANAEAARTAREDARVKADAARTERPDPRVQAETVGGNRNDVQRNPAAPRVDRPRMNADANAMQSDRTNARPDPRAYAPPRQERTDRPMQGPRPQPQARPPVARPAPPASPANDKKKEEEQKQQ